MRGNYVKIKQTLRGSFSSVSKPNFATKYALESSRRDPHNALLCTVLEAQIYVLKSLKTLQKKLPNVALLLLGNVEACGGRLLTLSSLHEKLHATNSL